MTDDTNLTNKHMAIVKTNSTQIQDKKLGNLEAFHNVTVIFHH
jgi:hypothetical protein